MLNHPGCLDSLPKDDSFTKVLRQHKLDNLDVTWQSPKFIILAHVLAMTFELGEKALVYSKCLRTLNKVEDFLQSKRWGKRVGSLREFFQSKGGLKKNRDYLRIDGSTESGKRGALVDRFNNDDKVRVFLISSIAGGLGINLVRPYN